MANEPNFLIVGAAKCGTTSLAYYLNLHPDIYVHPGEIHYFSKKISRGAQWYLLHFRETCKIQGEKSPTYLYNSQCHRQMHRLLPQAKILIVLRNPVDRAFSNWNMRYNDKRLILQGLEFNNSHNRRQWLTQLDFPAMVDYYLAHWDADTTITSQRPLDIFHRGLYFNQINSLLKFYPVENIMILISEKFFSNEKKNLDKVCRFLGQKPLDWDSQHLEKKMVGQYKHTMDKETRQKLYHFYSPYNEKLFQLLGERVTEWEQRTKTDD